MLFTDTDKNIHKLNLIKIKLFKILNLIKIIRDLCLRIFFTDFVYELSKLKCIHEKVHLIYVMIILKQLFASVIMVNIHLDTE